MGGQRGRIRRSKHTRGGGQDTKAGMANLSRYFQHKAQWRDRKEVAKAIQNELVRQVKATSTVPVGPARNRKPPWGSGYTAGGLSKAALTNPNHPKHIFKFEEFKIIYGAFTAGVIFNTKRYAHGVGTIPRLDFRQIGAVIALAIINLDVRKARSGTGSRTGAVRRSI